MPSPIKGIAQHDPVTPLGSRRLRAQGVLSGAGRGAKRGQALPKERALGDPGGDGAGAQECRRPPGLEGLPRGPRPPDLCLDNSLDIDL